MGLAQVVPLAEAAAFTLGCAVLSGRRMDPERAGAVLTMVAAALGFALLVAATATGAVAVAVQEPDAILVNPD